MKSKWLVILAVAVSVFALCVASLALLIALTTCDSKIRGLTPGAPLLVRTPSGEFRAEEKRLTSGAVAIQIVSRSDGAVVYTSKITCSKVMRFALHVDGPNVWLVSGDVGDYVFREDATGVWKEEALTPQLLGTLPLPRAVFNSMSSSVQNRYFQYVKD